MSKEHKLSVGLRPFTEVLGDLAQGDVEKELTTQLAEVVRACEATGKKGALTIKLNVAPGPKLMTMSVEAKTTIPRPSLEATSFYTDDKGSLHIDNPKQTTMFEAKPRIVGSDPDDDAS